MLMDALAEVEAAAVGTRASEGVEHRGGTALTDEVEVAVPLEGHLHAALLPDLVAHVAVRAGLIETCAAVDGVHLRLAHVELLQCPLAVARLIEGLGLHENNLDIAHQSAVAAVVAGILRAVLLGRVPLERHVASLAALPYLAVGGVALMVDGELLADVVAEERGEDLAGGIHGRGAHVEVLDAGTLVGVAARAVGTLLEDYLEDGATAELAVGIPLIDVGPAVAAGEGLAVVVAILQRIDVGHRLHGRVGRLVGVGRGVQLARLEPQAPAQRLPVLLSVIAEQLAHGELGAVDDVGAKAGHLLPLLARHARAGLIHQHLHQQAEGSATRGLAGLLCTPDGGQHDGRLAQVALDVGITFGLGAAGDDETVDRLHLGPQGHAAEGLHEIEVVEGAQELGLSVDAAHLLVGRIGRGRQLHAVDVGDDLVGAVDAAIVDLPALANPRVRRVETEHDELSHLRGQSLVGAQHVVGHGFAEAPLLVVVGIALQDVVGGVEGRLHLVGRVVVGQVSGIAGDLLVEEVGAGGEDTGNSE